MLTRGKKDKEKPPAEHQLVQPTLQQQCNHQYRQKVSVAGKQALPKELAAAQNLPEHLEAELQLYAKHGYDHQAAQQEDPL